jgi:putative membrane protein
VDCPIQNTPEKASSGFESPEETDMNRNPTPPDDLQQNLAEERTNWAHERTDWAHERTRLAKERTLAAWIRTALASVGIGLVVVRLLPSVEPRWLVRAFGIIFVLSGAVIFLLGFRTYCGVLKKLEKEGFEGTPAWFIGVLTAVLALSSVLGLVLVLAE